MATFAVPPLIIIGCSLRPEYPGQNAVASHDTGTIDVITHGPGLWAGQLELYLNHDEHAKRKQFMSWIAKMRGQANRMQFNLPKEYEPSNIPPLNWSATVGAVRRGAAGSVEILMNQQNGPWSPVSGDMINVGSRLYTIVQIHNDGYLSIAPLAVPQVAAVIEARFPFVVATPLDPSQLELSRTGYQYKRRMIDWIEHLA